MADEERRPTPHLLPFDAIQHVDEQLGEYWSARELYKILGYTSGEISIMWLSNEP